MHGHHMPDCQAPASEGVALQGSPLVAQESGGDHFIAQQLEANLQAGGGSSVAGVAHGGVPAQRHSAATQRSPALQAWAPACTAAALTSSRVSSIDSSSPGR